MSENTWSHRIARRAVRPLVGTPVTPNHLTVVRLATGGLAALLYAWGTDEARIYASFVFLLSAFLDRADGELARLADMRSERGHQFDIAADLASTTAFFVGLGMGFREGWLGGWAVAMGLWTGAAVLGIYWLREYATRPACRERASPGPGRLLDGDDFLYLVAPITWLGWLEPFLVGAGIGAPLFLAWVARDHLRIGAGAPVVADDGSPRMADGHRSGVE